MNPWGLVLPVGRADSQSTANTSACCSSPSSSGSGSSPAHVGTEIIINRKSVESINLINGNNMFLCFSQTSMRVWICGDSISAVSTLMSSGSPSSCRLSFSLLVIMLTVSSTFGLVLLLLLSCCSSVPVCAASLWSMLILRVSAGGLNRPCPLRLLSSDCFSFSSK